MSPKKMVILACLILILAGGSVAYFLSIKRHNEVVGIVSGHKIYEKDLDAKDSQSLFEATNQLYQAAENVLAKRYFQKIISDYKKQHNITDDRAAQQAYVEENIKVPEEKIQAFINENAENPQLKGKTYEEQKRLVEPYLMQEAMQSYFGSLIQKAAEDGKIKVLLLKKPIMPPVEVQISENDPSIGPKDAPVTIVEFADFQCPYCNATYPTVKELLQKYQGKIRFVFKNFPLLQIHDQAVGAAIAAKCAQEQNKYWEMHDKLFENYKNLSDTLYTNLATQLQLDLTKFRACQTNPKTQSEVMDDVQYGQTLGVTSTPAFYINGKLIMGAQPIAAFERVINEELSKH